MDGRANPLMDGKVAGASHYLQGQNCLSLSHLELVAPLPMPVASQFLISKDERKDVETDVWINSRSIGGSHKNPRCVGLQGPKQCTTRAHFMAQNVASH